ncbi:hypothetical protein DYI95_003980 [Thermaerobacter sp. PB12/4term]|uniref:hypothetical protein n=1 Tax=Thermaerobacter sp. PB12/4term TaxID=2293838 RepID=UPI000E3282C2|nr:hypothetical protein [Thermaerobacter sp. PB12/4term]QIA26791.1 hypothetical protein DYI95_003980 [Thermaerobacter sp. PB12/4term]
MERLSVYYDGWCPWCRRAARWCRRLDWLNRLDLCSFRPPGAIPDATRPGGGPAGYPAAGSPVRLPPTAEGPEGPEACPPLSPQQAAQAEQALLARGRDSGRWYQGFAAVQAITLRLPLLWPAVPVLALLGRLGAGPALYRILARHRPVLLPVPGACPLPRPVRWSPSLPAGQASRTGRIFRRGRDARCFGGAAAGSPDRRQGPFPVLAKRAPVSTVSCRRSGRR